MDESQAKFTRHWTKAHPVLKGYILSMVPDFHEAEDILQDVAEVLIRKFDDYDPERPFTAWALGVARNRILAARRTHATSRIRYSEELVEALGSAYEEMAPELSARARALRECMRKIRGKSLEVVNLRYGRSLPSADIAQRIGTPHGTVRSVLSRIRRQLSECVSRTLRAAEATR
jgi:RNA polymerase sigma-70 factor (ECF subfamily)